jgi:purine-binding chemotaxis protein CheW
MAKKAPTSASASTPIMVQKGKTMQPPAADSPSSKKGAYGTFFLGKSEFAIDISQIQEVVNCPQQMTQLPRSPAFLQGIFNLRGMIIPVIDMHALLKIQAARVAPQKVAIVQQDGIPIGLAFTSTGEILRIEGGMHSSAKQLKDGIKNCVRGTLRRPDGKHLINVLDVTGAVDIQNLGYVVLHQKRLAAEQASRRGTNEGRKRCVSFRAGSYALAFDIAGIKEIIAVPEISGSAFDSQLCLGIISLRGVPLPLLDMARLLGYTGKAPPADSETRRAIVLSGEHSTFALLIDAVDSLISCAKEELIAVPVFEKGLALWVAGCICRPNLPDLILLDHQKLMAHPEIISLTHGHKRLYGMSEEVASLRAKSQRRCYITYYLNYLAGISIDDIDEIILHTDDMTPSPGSPSHLPGLLNLRGKIIPIIDVRNLYGLEPIQSTAKLPVLIIKRFGESYGLIVDAVDQIVFITAEEKIRASGVLLGDASMALHEDLAEHFQAPQFQHAEVSKHFKSLIVFDLDKLLKRAFGEELPGAAAEIELTEP